MKYIKGFVLFVSLALFVLLEFYFYNPKTIYIVLVSVDLTIIFTLWAASHYSDINKEWWNFSLLPVVFFSAVVAYSTLLRNAYLAHLLFFGSAILIYYYLRLCYYYLLKPFLYKASSIENFSSYVNFLSFFLFVSTLYGLQSFLDMPAWQMILILMTVSSLLIYQVIWANKFKLEKSFEYLILGSLSVVELGWAIYYFPVNSNVSGLTLAILYYILIGLIRFKLSGKLDRPKIKLFLAFGFVSIIIILLTARWL